MYDHMLTKFNPSYLSFEKNGLNEIHHLMWFKQPLQFRYYFDLNFTSKQVWTYAVEVITLLHITWENDLNEVLHLIDLKP